MERTKKSMSYVGNVVAFLEFLIQHKREGYNVYNYVDKPDFTTNDLVYHTGEILGKKIPTNSYSILDWDVRGLWV